MRDLCVCVCVCVDDVDTSEILSVRVTGRAYALHPQISTHANARTR